jgi:predicted CopG family antitoxin
MNRPFLMSAAIAMSLWSCGERNRSAESIPDSTAAADTTAKVESPYFPVYDFLSNEIEYVDSTPVGIMKYSTIGKVKDSGYIQLEEFHKLVSEFQTPEIKDSSLKQKFTETSFVDKSNGNATFFYKPRDTSTLIKRIDVVTAKGEVYDEVKSLYIEKDASNSGSSVIKKLIWKPKRNFQIIAVTPSGKNELIKVVWDNRE